MREIKIESVPLNRALSGGLFHPGSGMMLVAPGTHFTRVHQNSLRRSGLSCVIEFDEREAPDPRIPGSGGLEPVSLGELKPGLLAGRSLYTAAGLRLFAPGDRLTRGCLTMLRSAGYETVYQLDVPAPFTHAQVFDRARERARALEAQVDAQTLPLVQTPPDPAAAGLASDVLELRDPRAVDGGRRALAQWVSRFGDLSARLGRGERLACDPFEEMAGQCLDALEADRLLWMGLLQLAGPDDFYVHRHSVRVAATGGLLGRAMGFGRGQVRDLMVAGLLHDLGMMLVPRALLNLPRVLNRREISEMRRHVTYSLGVLDMFHGGGVEAAAAILYQGHERENGSGYPGGRRKDRINVFSKILAVADVYEALITPRPHRGALPPYQAVGRLVYMASTGLLSRRVVRAFLETFSLFPVGSVLRLRDGALAQVVGVNPAAPAKPVVRLLRGAGGGAVRGRPLISLAEAFAHVGRPADEVLDPAALGLSVLSGLQREDPPSTSK